MPVKILDNITVIECATFVTGPYAEELEHPQAGKLSFVGGPVQYDNFARENSLPPPLVGEHSAKILRELGFDSDAIKVPQSQGAR